MAEISSHPNNAVLIIGGGMGGLIAAIQAQDSGVQAIFGGIFSGIWAQTSSGTWTYRSNHDLLAASLQVCLVFGRVAGESAAAHVRGPM